MKSEVLSGWKNLMGGLISVILILMVFSNSFATQTGKEITLQNDLWRIFIQPDSLQIIAQPTEGERIQISAAQENLSPATEIRQKDNVLSWELPEQKVTIYVQLERQNLSIRICARESGTFSFPLFRQMPNLKALILPRWEGCYIPLNDKIWVNYLIEYGVWDTLEGFCMPFWGVDCGEYILTFIITNRYHNAIRFSESDGQLEFKFTHEFIPARNDKEYGFLIRLSRNTSPVEPAKEFRKWLIERGKFVSMREKMKKIPKVRRLLGAAHIYLWGDALITRHDIYRNKWVSFCKKLVEQGKSDTPSPGKRIKELMNPDCWAKVVEISTMKYPYDYIKTEVTNELSRLLERRDFYDERAWQGIQIPDEARRLLNKERDSLSEAELCRMNCLLLQSAYPEYMLEVDDWGNGVSVKMLKKLQRNGFDRLRLCVDGWRGIEKRPTVARVADEMGYLFGTYDSYHSIHNPALRGTDATWDTAQFDQELYEKGPIVGKDGKKLTGFKGRGYKLSPIAAFPYVKKRVSRIMKNVPFNYWFVDCDAYGEVYDDYSPLHPASQEDDVNARLQRLAWIRDTYKLVIGSEGGSSYAAPVIHIAEGVVTPVFGWGDPDMKDKNSKYYLGAYYPPDGPRVFMKQVPLKEKYKYLFYDPRFRLPLYEIVFHDSVVSTHHWSRGSLKFTNVLDTVALTELLYMTPPLYHLNLDEFEKHKETMKSYYEFFSPLHRELGFSQMTEFTWLDKDHLIQRTVFKNRVELVANFSSTAFDYQGITIPPRSILAKWRDSEKTCLFTPGQPS